MRSSTPAGSSSSSRRSGVAVGASVQQALGGTATLWLLNHAHVGAQIGVVPAALIWLHRRDRPAYRRLRHTVLARPPAPMAGLVDNLDNDLRSAVPHTRRP